MSDAPLRPRRTATAPVIARHGRLGRPSAARTIVKGVAMGVAVLLVSGLSVGTIALWDLNRSVQANTIDISDGTEQTTVGVGALDGGFNVLLAGSDTRQGQGDGYGKTDGALNDVNMVLHVSADHSQASVVSLPRDMVVPIPACARSDGSGTAPAQSAAPLNTALSDGGLPCVAKTVAQFTGLDIPYAALIEFNGVIEMSNAVGGVPVCLASPLKDKRTDLDLPAGVTPLQGKQALQFLRTRHAVGDGSDLARISNQQVFLSALVRTMKQSSTLSDPTRVYGLAKAAVDNMQRSTSLDYQTMASMALALKDIPLDQVHFLQYPGTTAGTGVYAGKVQPLKTDGDQLMQLLKTDAPFEVKAGNTGLGAVDETPSQPTATPAPSASSGAGGGSAPAASSSPTVLPEAVTGTDAGTVTCSKAFKG
ncbi:MULTISPECIES: LCP family protein [Clavibacter]|uniref:LytR family transcriptional regulator n=2 Tax=Clavibacter TaxID=1573 RepID=A0A399NY07_9MICO|nr:MULTISPECIES: LCP family protein [Clavibacter]KDP91209.1 LytR family transcriptional regulator [Clavibacter cf. michiganensis LMG 26808]RII98794.1 LytR family transcriptional regulator [Clavibacter michiganensis]UKF25587.1 LCP family protein [Clavibacter sp. A6099]